jgi:hypothetical protein
VSHSFNAEIAEDNMVCPACGSSSSSSLSQQQQQQDSLLDAAVMKPTAAYCSTLACLPALLLYVNHCCGNKRT